jgi:hypothetical protein
LPACRHLLQALNLFLGLRLIGYNPFHQGFTAVPSKFHINFPFSAKNYIAGKM